jgi:hypothetical protein
MIIEVEVTEDQFEELKMEMSMKKAMIQMGMMDKDIRDDICIQVLRGCRKDMQLDKIATSLADGDQ